MAVPQEAKLFAQKNILRGLRVLGRRDDVTLKEGSSDASVSEETLIFMGVQKMKVFPSEDLESYPEQQILLNGILPVSDGAQIVASKDEANIIFLPGSSERKLPGMWKFKREFHSGKAGMAVAPPRPEARGKITTEEIWTTLGYSFAPYSIQLIANRKGDIVAVVPGSMEGAWDYTSIDDGYKEAAMRIRFIGATEKVTKNIEDWGFPEEDYLNSQATEEIIATCRLLREWMLMPQLDLSKFVPNETRLDEVMTLLGTTGLSTGNASIWERGKNRMRITASGVDKGNLRSDQILPVVGFSKDFNGVVVSLPQGVKPKKASVEAFDNLLNYYVSLGIQAKEIKTADIREIVAFAQDSERVQAALERNEPEYIRQIHFHAHPVAWDPELVTVVEPNTNLVPYGNANASCGTRALAYYTAEMVARGILASEGRKVVIAKLPKHGSQVVSPFSFTKTMSILNQMRLAPVTIFAPVNMEE